MAAVAKRRLVRGDVLPFGMAGLAAYVRSTLGARNLFWVEGPDNADSFAGMVNHGALLKVSGVGTPCTIRPGCPARPPGTPTSVTWSRRASRPWWTANGRNEPAPTVNLRRRAVRAGRTRLRLSRSTWGT